MSSPANRKRLPVIPLGDAQLQKAGTTTIVQELAHQYLRRDGLAHFFLEKDFQILWANEAAQALLAQQFVLKEKDGRLRIHGRENQERVKDLVSLASEGERICLSCEQSKRHVLLEVIPLLDSGSIVLTARIAEKLALTVDTLSAAFGFTMAESGLVQKMFQGMTVEEIATRMGVSVNTMRTHIRNIYGKLSVSSREGMMNRLLPYIIP